MFNIYLMVAETGFDFKGELVKMFISLGVIVGLLVFIAWWLRRGSKGRLLRVNAGRHIKVLERRPLSAKTALYLVEVEGKRLLVSDSPAGVRHIAELSSHQKADSPFSKVLEKSKIGS